MGNTSWLESGYGAGWSCYGYLRGNSIPHSEVTNRYELSIYLIYKLKHVLRIVKVSWICHGCRKNGTLGNLGKKNRSKNKLQKIT